MTQQEFDDFLGDLTKGWPLSKYPPQALVNKCRQRIMGMTNGDLENLTPKEAPKVQVELKKSAFLIFFARRLLVALATSGNSYLFLDVMSVLNNSKFNNDESLDQFRERIKGEVSAILPVSIRPTMGFEFNLSSKVSDNINLPLSLVKLANQMQPPITVSTSTAPPPVSPPKEVSTKASKSIFQPSADYAAYAGYKKGKKIIAALLEALKEDSGIQPNSNAAVGHAQKYMPEDKAMQDAFNKIYTEDFKERFNDRWSEAFHAYATINPGVGSSTFDNEYIKAMAGEKSFEGSTSTFRQRIEKDQKTFQKEVMDQLKSITSTPPPPQSGTNILEAGHSGKKAEDVPKQDGGHSLKK